MPLLRFAERSSKEPRLTADKRTLVDRDTFSSSFSAFTHGAFSSFDEKNWANIFVAGGAVLAALLPLEAHTQQHT
jgi:hypothetical protein